MNELQVKTIELEPAVIKFNHTDIERELQKNLAKYEGLTFTSESTTELRSTLADLRKGKKAVDEYRKKIKRELSAPIKNFEDTCKHLNEYFNDVIEPLNDQLKHFVAEERASKLKELEKVKAELIEKHDLNTEYVDRVEIQETFLAKSTSMKTATDSIEFQIKNLKMEQDKKAADKKVVESTAKLANAENDMSLSVEAYLTLLETKNLEEVETMINSHIEGEVKRREEEKAKQEAKRIEEERLRAEQEARRVKEEQEAKRIEEERIKAEQEEEKEVEPEIVEEVTYKAPPIEVTAPIEDIQESVSIDDLPFGDISDGEITDFEPMSEVSYKVVATNEDHEALMDYMKRNGIEFQIEMELPF